MNFSAGSTGCGKLSSIIISTSYSSRATSSTSPIRPSMLAKCTTTSSPIFQKTDNAKTSSSPPETTIPPHCSKRQKKSSPRSKPASSVKHASRYKTKSFPFQSTAMTPISSSAPSHFSLPAMSASHSPAKRPKIMSIIIAMA